MEDLSEILWCMIALTSCVIPVRVLTLILAIEVLWLSLIRVLSRRSGIPAYLSRVAFASLTSSFLAGWHRIVCSLRLRICNYWVVRAICKGILWSRMQLFLACRGLFLQILGMRSVVGRWHILLLRFVLLILASIDIWYIIYRFWLFDYRFEWRNMLRSMMVDLGFNCREIY